MLPLSSGLVQYSYYISTLRNGDAFFIFSIIIIFSLMDACWYYHGYFICHDLPSCYYLYITVNNQLYITTNTWGKIVFLCTVYSIIYSNWFYNTSCFILSSRRGLSLGKWSSEKWSPREIQETQPNAPKPSSFMSCDE